MAEKSSGTPPAVVLNISAHGLHAQAGQTISNVYHNTSYTGYTGYYGSGSGYGMHRNHGAPSRSEVPGSIPTDRPLDFKVMNYISNHIGGEWRFLGRGLGLEDDELENINADHQTRGINEVAYQMLLKYKQSNNLEATVGKLIRVLTDLGRTDMADAIQENCMD